jgi:hypothetical protein
MNSMRHTNNLASLEARLGSRLAAALTARSQDLPHDVSERLRFARQQAVTRPRQAQAASGSTLVGVSSGGSAVVGGFAPWWQRTASVLPLVVLVAGMLMIERWAAREQVIAAAEIDAQLLADDLPPAAYSDPGFGEYLRTSPTP